MFRTTGMILAIALFSALPLDRSFAADREKVEEGRYAVLKNGGMVQGTEHSWALWRLADGSYELEDHFPVDKSMAWFGIWAAPGMPTSPGFRESLKNGVWPSHLMAVYSPDHRLLSLTVKGKKLDGNIGEGLKCKTSPSSIECVGTSDKAKLHLREPRGLFWWYGVPMLLRSWIRGPQESPPGNGPSKIAVLYFGYLSKTVENPKLGTRGEPGARADWGDRPALESADLTVSSLGPDTLVMGDKSFHAQKYKLESKGEKGDPLSLTAWTDANGVILAVADESKPNDVIALVQYKKYPSAAPSAPAQPAK